MSRRSSAKVFGGNETPSGVQSAFSRSVALRLHPIDDARAFAYQIFAFAGRTLGIFLLKARNRRHAAMIRFTP
jgi:hypothetical protein